MICDLVSFFDIFTHAHLDHYIYVGPHRCTHNVIQFIVFAGRNKNKEEYNIIAKMAYKIFY